MTTTSRVCYYTNEAFYNHDQRGYEIGKVTENEAGYVACLGLYPTPDAAANAADRLNADLGLDRDTVLAIVASSMAQGPVGGADDEDDDEDEVCKDPFEEGCRARLDDGEGWDGACGNCADRTENDQA